MPVRDGPLKPMTMSGHCKWPGPTFGHEACKTPTCTCQCHKEKKVS